MNGTTIIREDDSVVCKACNKAVSAEFAVEITDTKDPDDQGRVVMGGKITGMRIQHDCMPPVLRPRVLADRPQA